MVASKTRVLFVCTGNICRSPTAEAVFTKVVADAGLSDRIEVDSVGTIAYHTGHPPDPRTQRAAGRRGIPMGHLRARIIEAHDYEQNDLILAMGPDHVAHMREQCPPQHAAKMHLFLEFAAELDEPEVPDPYYGGPDGFDLVLDMIEVAAAGLLQHIRDQWSRH